MGYEERRKLKQNMSREAQRETEGEGIAVVSVSPGKWEEESPALRRIRAIQQSNRDSWSGLALSYILPPLGLKLTPSDVPQLQAFDSRAVSLLQELLSELGRCELPMNFTCPTEAQIVKDAAPQSLYSKGTYMLGQDLLYRVYQTDAKLVRSVLELGGFSATDSHDWNLLWANSSPKSYLYEGLNEHQRINHFPKSNEITRKDSLCANVVRMQSMYGRQAYGFVPETFILPEEFADFCSEFNRERGLWIVKPSASSQGRGIFLVEELADVPLGEDCVISRYVSNPLLLNSLKFDLRVYVLVTCFEPLRIYVFQEGLTRFASEAYNPKSVSSRYTFLTNYSVNKKNTNFVQNETPDKDDFGHKWSLSALTKHLESVGIDMSLLWAKIYDIIIKTIVALDPIVNPSIKKLGLSRCNCFDLFGFDVLIDSNLQPWLLEVNLSPSLGIDSPLDLAIKGQLIADAFTLVGIRTYDRRKDSLSRARSRIASNQARKAASNPPNGRPSQETPQSFFSSLKFKQILKETIEENNRRGHFLRVFPAPGSSDYFKFFAVQRTSNVCLYEALYGAVVGIGKQVRQSAVGSRRTAKGKKGTCGRCGKAASPQSSVCPRCLPVVSTPSPPPAKIKVSSDDIILEYCLRLVNALRTTPETALDSRWKLNLERFLSHRAWLGPDLRKSGLNMRLSDRLEVRIAEIRMRKSKLSVGSEADPESDLKSAAIRKLTSVKLETVLRTSVRNTASDLAASLFDSDGSGFLTSIQKLISEDRNKRQCQESAYGEDGK